MAHSAPKRRLRIVTIGGGTGSFTVLSGLKQHAVDLTVIVAMSDDGGSTGRLRDEFGVLPPGDVRQALVALSEDDTLMRQLFNHRYASGSLKGHSFGNIFLSTLEHITGDMNAALKEAGEILKIRGRVVPVTLSKVRLVVELKNGKRLRGEGQVDEYLLLSRFGVKSMRLAPEAVANPAALAAIRNADLIVVGPGDLYTSLMPDFLVRGIGKACMRSKARKVYVANLMNRLGHTDGFSVGDYVHTLEAAMGGRFDYILFNTATPPRILLKRYADEGEPVHLGAHDARVVGCDLLAEGVATHTRGDALRRTLIRHDPAKLARALLKLMRE